jgi:hypothetical protein
MKNKGKDYRFRTNKGKQEKSNKATNPVQFELDLLLYCLQGHSLAGTAALGNFYPGFA